MNFQAKNLMELVGKKSPTDRYKKFIIRLLNCLRDARSTQAISNKEIAFLLNKIKERDEVIDSLRRKNLLLMTWKKEHEKNLKSPKVDVLV